VAFTRCFLTFQDSGLLMERLQQHAGDSVDTVDTLKWAMIAMGFAKRFKW